jgi:tetratricopeptide (TPR) repeat protein
MAASLNGQIGDIFTLTGQANRARECYQSALSRVPGHQFVWQARLYRKIGKTHLSPMNIEAAIAACDSAETALSHTPDEQVEETWQEWLQVQFDRIWLYHVHARFREISDLVEKVRPVVETYGTPAQMVAFYASISRRNLTRDRYLIIEETLIYAETALKASQKTGNDAMFAQAQFAYAFYKTWHDDLEEGEELFRAALQTAERIGDALLQAQCLTYLGIALRRLGRVDKTHQVSLQARAIDTEVQRPEYIGTALSNLGWVAYRLGNQDECREQCLAALELWRPLSIQYPFCWVALLPLMSVALTKRQVAEAIEYARMLLAPNQQRLPDPLTGALETAIQAWKADQPETARAHFQQANTLAQQAGYL